MKSDRVQKQGKQLSLNRINVLLASVSGARKPLPIMSIGPDVEAWLRSVRDDFVEWVGVLEADGVRSMKDIEGYDQEDIESVGKALLSARAPRLTIKLLLHAMTVVSAPSSAVPSSSDILMTPVRDISSDVRPASSCSSGLGSINMPEGLEGQGISPPAPLGKARAVLEPTRAPSKEWHQQDMTDRGVARVGSGLPRGTGTERHRAFRGSSHSSAAGTSRLVPPSPSPTEGNVDERTRARVASCSCAKL